MRTETKTVETPGGPMPVYIARPAGSATRAVIVIQEAFGVNDHIQDVTQRAAVAGYLAVAPHIFHRSGGGTVAYGNMEGVMKHFQALSDAGVLEDLDATLALLHDEGIEDSSVGIVGFCVGGRMTFLAGAARALGAAVSFYGGGIVGGRSEAMPSLVPLVSTMRTPWLGLFGDKDKGIPVEQVEQLQAELPKAPVETEIVRYPDAGHGFHCDARPEAYNADAAADGWKRTLAWFEQHLS
ncbi:MAG: dienelactone hydrolase family protein [Actinomycetota bacterium]